MKPASAASRALSLGATLLVVLGASPLLGLLSGCAPEASSDEAIHLKITGTCGTQLSEFDVTQPSSNVLSLNYPATATAVPLPRHGALGAAGHPFRQGGWLLWGCVAGAEPCPGTFRLCTARRVDWQLNVTCVDGTGAPACQAVLTE